LRFYRDARKQKHENAPTDSAFVCIRAQMAAWPDRTADFYGQGRR